MATEKGPAKQNGTQQSRPTIKKRNQRLNNDSISAYLRELTNDNNIDYSLWKATKNLMDQFCRFPQAGKQMGRGLGTMNKITTICRTPGTYIPTAREREEEKEMTTEDIVQENEEIKLTSTTQVKNEINKNINPKKAPGFDLTTGEVLKQLPRKATVKITNLINAAFRLQCVPRLWKVAEVIMIPTPGNSRHAAASYRPI